MPLFDISSVTGAALDRIGRNLGYFRRIGESDSALYGRVREGIGLGAPTFDDLDYQVRLALDVAQDMLPLTAENSDVQDLALSLSELSIPKLRLIRALQIKYKIKGIGKSEKKLNRFQILKGD